MASVTLAGDKALERKIKRLTEMEERRVVSKASRKAMTPMAKEARKIAKGGDGTGFFAKNIATKVKVYKKGHVIVAMTGAKSTTDPVTGENPAKIAHLIEDGTEPHFIRSKKGVFRRGSILSNINDPRVDANANQEVTAFGFEVKHPGSDGLHMFSKAFVRNHKKAATIYQRELAKDIEREAKRGGFKV